MSYYTSFPPSLSQAFSSSPLIPFHGVYPPLLPLRPRSQEQHFFSQGHLASGLIAQSASNALAAVRANSALISPPSPLTPRGLIPKAFSSSSAQRASSAFAACYPPSSHQMPPSAHLPCPRRASPAKENLPKSPPTLLPLWPQVSMPEADQTSRKP